MNSRVRVRFNFFLKDCNAVLGSIIYDVCILCFFFQICSMQQLKTKKSNYTNLGFLLY